jgi:hypothetical protein
LESTRELARDVKGVAYSARGGLLVRALASDLEGNIVGSVALYFKGSGGKVVEVLVEKLFMMVVSYNVIFRTSRARLEKKKFMRDYKAGWKLVLFFCQGSAYVICRLGDVCKSWDGHDDGCGGGIEVVRGEDEIRGW